MDASRVIILGAGGFAKELAEIVQLTAREGGLALVGFADRDRSRTGETLVGATILGTLGDAGVVAGDYGVPGAGDVAPRERQIDEMLAAGLEPLTLVHPRATVSAHARLGAGCVICPTAVVSCDTDIGAYCIVNYGATVGHDVCLGRTCVVGPGVHLSGWVIVEDGCYFGAGAVVLPRLRIGRGAVIGAGAVVTHDVAAAAVVTGMPARAQVSGESAPCE